MFKNVKLAGKMGIGFGSLLVIMLALGGVAIWNMLAVKQDATVMARETVPAVDAAGDIQQDLARAMLESRTYGCTGDKHYLEAARKGLQDVRKRLDVARTLAASSASLDELRQSVERAAGKTAEYEQSISETEVCNDAMATELIKLGELGTKYQAVCDEFMASQQKQMLAEIEAVSTVVSAPSTQPSDNVDSQIAFQAHLKDRLNKITMVNKIAELGNAIRIGNLRAQVLRQPKLFQEVLASFDEVDKLLGDLRVVTRQEVNLRQIEDCSVTARTYRNLMQSFVANWQTRDELGKRRLVLATAVQTEVDNTANTEKEAMTRMTQQAAASMARISTVLTVGLAVSIGLGLCMAIVITRSITGPVNRVIQGLKLGAEQTASASSQVAQASQQMASGASEQASGLEEVSSSLEEMSSMTKQNADNAHQANTMASQAKSAAEQGNAAMTRMASAISQIKSSSDQTAKIVKTIDEIAFQTNLLALNAAVEAARAGEAGKGFAVVAEEVRNLAQRSAEAAKNTASLIEESQKNADNGVAVSTEVAGILVQIVTGVQKVNQLIGEVSTASNEQAQGIEQINAAIAEMDKVTQSNAANAEESASASEELSAQARELNDMVNALIGIVGGASATHATQPSDRRPHASHSHRTMRAPPAGPGRPGAAQGLGQAARRDEPPGRLRRQPDHSLAENPSEQPGTPAVLGTTVGTEGWAEGIIPSAQRAFSFLS